MSSDENSTYKHYTNMLTIVCNKLTWHWSVFPYKDILSFTKCEDSCIVKTIFLMKNANNVQRAVLYNSSMQKDISLVRPWSRWLSLAKYSSLNSFKDIMYTLRNLGTSRVETCPVWWIWVSVFTCWWQGGNLVYTAWINLALCHGARLQRLCFMLWGVLSWHVLLVSW